MSTLAAAANESLMAGGDIERCSMTVVSGSPVSSPRLCRWKNFQRLRVAIKMLVYYLQ